MRLTTPHFLLFAKDKVIASVYLFTVDTLNEIVSPSKSPRQMRNDKLDIKDIQGSQPKVNGNIKFSQTRDANLNV